ncbi:MAG: hypothetical protein AAB427_06385, partial [Chloroflexota bacterium]
MPWLLAAVKPALRALAMRRTEGKSEATICALPSLEALSTTMISVQPSVNSEQWTVNSEQLSVNSEQL